MVCVHVSVCVPLSGLELCEPSLRLLVTMMAGLMTTAGELLLLAVALGCQSWRGLLGAGAAPLTLFLSYRYQRIHTRNGFCFHLDSITIVNQIKLKVSSFCAVTFLCCLFSVFVPLSFHIKPHCVIL